MAQQSQGHNTADFNKTVTANSLVSMLATVIYLVTRVVVPPVTLNYLGVETWGIWSFCFVITGYLGMGAFGITNVYIRYTAVFHGQGDTDAISRLVATGLALTGAGSVVVIAALYFLMPGIIAYFNISEANRDMAFMLFYTTAATFLLQVTLSAFSCILQGLQRIAADKKAHIAATLTETVMIVAGLVAGLGVYALMLAFLVRNLLFVLQTRLLVRRALPDLRLGPAQVDRRMLPYFYTYGGALQLNGLLNMFASTLDRFLFMKFYGEKAAGFLDIGQKFPRMAIFIPGAISGVIYPAVAHLQQGAHHDEIEQLYIRGCRYINLIIAGLMGFMAPFATEIMTVWLGPDTPLGMGPFLMVLFTLPFHAHVFTGPASAVFNGLGTPFHETRYPVFKLAALALAVGVAWSTGLTERTLALAVAAGFFVSPCLYTVYANWKLRIGAGLFLRRALLPGLWPYALGYALAALTAGPLSHLTDSRLHLALGMLPTGCTFVGLVLLVYWLTVFTPSEKQAFLGALRRRLGRSGGA